MCRAGEVVEDIGPRHYAQKAVLFHHQQEACVVRTERLYQLLDGCREGDRCNARIQEVMHRLLLEPHEGSLLESFLGHDTDTVSYTHLRAHETRHDLVCRLLLEKKN